MKKTLSILALTMLVLLLSSCSSQISKDPAGANLPSMENQDMSQRAFLGYYNVNLDPETMTGSISVDRSVSGHMSAKTFLTGWPCGNCLKIENLQFLPGNIVECDIKVTHPAPIAIYTVFDLRVIAIFPADQVYYGVGVSTALQNRDGLTRLWDNPSIYGAINGYKAYNKSETRRPFGPGDVFSEHFQVKLPDGSLKYDIAVDASWEPNDGVNFPITMNSLEVVDLSGNISAGLTDQGGSAQLTVNMYDYQGSSTIASATAYSPDLFNAPVSLSYLYGDGFNASYGAVISNQKLAPAKPYNVLVKVADSTDGSFPYEIASYVILPVDVQAVLTSVEVTLAEDAAMKTLGNYYDYFGYSGAAPSIVINYRDGDGPWDFTVVPFTNSGRRNALSVDDPEVAGFKSNFPNAEYFMKIFGSFGSGSVYQAERHDYGSSKLLQYGLYSMETFGGAVVFQGTIDGFRYPYNSSSNFTLNMTAATPDYSGKLTWKTQAMGTGLCKVPYGGGITKSAILMRSTVEVKVLVITVLKAVMYEWYDDKGNLLAVIGATNIAGQTANWDEATYEITGTGAITALKDYYRQ